MMCVDIRFDEDKRYMRGIMKSNYIKYKCVDYKYNLYCFFFFKQKTAYEMLRSLVGSEMCIRDRS